MAMSKGTSDQCDVGAKAMPSEELIAAHAQRYKNQHLRRKRKQTGHVSVESGITVCSHLDHRKSKGTN